RGGPTIAVLAAPGRTVVCPPPVIENGEPGGANANPMSSGTLPVFLTMTGRLSVSPFFQVSAVGVTLARGFDTRAPKVTATVFEPAGAAGAVWTVIVEFPAAVVARSTETVSTPP